MLNLLSIPSFSVVFFHKSEVNRLPLSVMTFLGMPCNRMISLRNIVANFRAFRFLLQGMKWLILVRRSMTTRIVSYPSEIGRSMMKSMAIDFYGWSGTSLDWSIP